MCAYVHNMLCKQDSLHLVHSVKALFVLYLHNMDAQINVHMPFQRLEKGKLILSSIRANISPHSACTLAVLFTCNEALHCISRNVKH